MEKVLIALQHCPCSRKTARLTLDIRRATELLGCEIILYFSTSGAFQHLFALNIWTRDFLHRAARWTLARSMPAKTLQWQPKEATYENPWKVQNKSRRSWQHSFRKGSAASVLVALKTSILTFEIGSLRLRGLCSLLRGTTEGENKRSMTQGTDSHHMFCGKCPRKICRSGGGGGGGVWCDHGNIL